VSTRYDELLSEFGPEEAAIIGGPRDRAPAAKLRLPFVFNGDLAAAVGALLFGQRWIPAGRVLRRWREFFRRQAQHCVLVVANDTLPMSLLLVKIARRCPNVSVVCLQHGLFNAGSDGDDIDGRNSQINLVYTDTQRREMERRLPGAIVEVMGLPIEMRCLDAGPGPTREAILVGPGLLDNLPAYRATLQAFGRVARLLQDAGFDVRYRPHPSEFDVHEGKDAFVLDRTPKRELLCGPRRAFIGLNSTLLCEAHAAGHAVVVLVDPLLPISRVEDFGEVVSSDALEQLPAAIDRQAPRDFAREPGQSPRIRFEAALARAQARLLR
jgi:hypothetical protein